MEDFIEEDDDIRDVNPLVLPLVALAVVAVGLAALFFPYVVPACVAAFAGGAITMFWIMEWADKPDARC